MRNLVAYFIRTKPEDTSIPSFRLGVEPLD